MKFQGAIIKEQGVTFAIIIVKHFVTQNRSQATNFISSAQTIFPGIPIILMSQDNRGVPYYFGRNDIVKFMAQVPLQAISWKEFTIQ